MLVAELEPLALRSRSLADLRLDDAPLERYAAARGVSLNGKLRSSVVTDLNEGAVDLSWLEPHPGIDPVARRIAGLRVRTDRGDRVGIVTPVERFELEEGQLVRAVFYTMTLAIGTTPDWHIMRWWLEPGGSDATLRADALAFLESFHQSGDLEIVDESGDRVTALRLPGAPFDPELKEARGFVTEVAALEEWSGVKIPLPDEAGADEVAEVARAAAIVRARVVPLTLPERLELTVRTQAPGFTSVDTVAIPREIRAQPLGVDIPLGIAEVLAAVEVAGVTERDDGFVTLSCRPTPTQPRSVTAHLSPPPSRSRQVRRTLVGGAPLPPDGLLSEVVAADLRHRALTSFLADELGDRKLPANLLQEIEAKWPV